MQYLLLMYIDPALLQQVPEDEFNTEMRHCLQQADRMAGQGTLAASAQLEPVQAAKSLRTRGDRTVIVDGPFAETKEVLAGYNLIEAASMEEALTIAQQFPWSRHGCIEVRPLSDMAAMRRRVGA